ncbi:hypothetical protein C8034_v003695 [Colletotrichum sidae]|uniref:Uncharacterized protein n=1 Tax=Colletotrichum sidae TaxID=1347389 RepID=A0A4V3I3M1_9PEZI|nr:hypothetical protein C8034_v003695 [Colletotrichum sidae]
MVWEGKAADQSRAEEAGVRGTPAASREEEPHPTSNSNSNSAQRQATATAQSDSGVQAQRATGFWHHRLAEPFDCYTT